MPGAKHAWPKSAACWSPAMPPIGISRPAIRAEIAPRGRHGRHDARQHRRRNAEQLEQMRVPVAGLDVEQQRAAGVRDVGDVRARRRSGSRSSQLSIVPKASSPRSARRRSAGSLSSNQASLVAEKYGSSTQPRAARDLGFVALGPEPLAGVRGAAILPDDGRRNGPTGRAIPEHRGFALVGDPDRGDVRRGQRARARAPR